MNWHCLCCKGSRFADLSLMPIGGMQDGVLSKIPSQHDTSNYIGFFCLNLQVSSYEHMCVHGTGCAAAGRLKHMYSGYFLHQPTYGEHEGQALCFICIILCHL